MTFLAKIKYLVHHIPAPVRTAAEHVAVVAGTTFVATAKPLLPQLVATPSLSLTRAAILTCATAALTAGYQAGKAAYKSLSAKWAALPVDPAAQATPAADPSATTNG